MDSDENPNDTTVVVEQHTLGRFFTFRDMNKGEHVISEEVHVTSDHVTPPTFPLDEKETSYADNSSSIIYEVGLKEQKKEKNPSDNDSFRIQLVVMSGSHYYTLYLSSKEM